MRFRYSMLLTIASVSLAGAEPEVEIRAFIAGADPGTGQLLGSLFDSAESYMQEPIAQIDARVDEQGSAMLDFGEHAAGEYAVVVVYDRNSDGVLNTGFLGIPKEKIGFSNNARSRFGPAKWKDARFDVLENVQIEIQLKAAKD